MLLPYLLPHSFPPLLLLACLAKVQFRIQFAISTMLHAHEIAKRSRGRGRGREREKGIRRERESVDSEGRERGRQNTDRERK